MLPGGKNGSPNCEARLSGFGVHQTCLTPALFRGTRTALIRIRCCEAMKTAFDEAVFRRRVDAALVKVKTILENNRLPQVRCWGTSVV